MTLVRGHIEAVVFDLDGTLVDTMDALSKGYADTIHARGGPRVSRDELVSAWWRIGPTPRVLAYFLDRPTAADDMDCFDRCFDAAMVDIEPFPGVRRMLDTLAGSGYRLGIVTGASRRAATVLLASTGLGTYFQVMICGDEISEPKPDPAGLRQACRRLGVDTAEAAYVGDAPINLQCAQLAGSRGIHAAWGPQLAAVAARWVAHDPLDVARQLDHASTTQSDGGRNAS